MSIKHFLLYCLLLQIPYRSFGQEYKVTVDLKNVIDDKVKVSIDLPLITESEAEMVFPAVIPGSYSKKDFGRFIKDLKVLDANGKKIKVKRTGTNVFLIKKANKARKVEYWVEDTWDAPDDNFIFQPGGTNIHSGKNFVINHQGFFGYLEGKKMLPYTIILEKPEGFYSSTSLKVGRGKEKDTLFAPNYVQLVDNPVMVCLADTSSFYAGKTKISVSIYSETGMYKSIQIAESLKPLAGALENFFSGLPVDHYNFIMYLPRYAKEGVSRYGGFGALEHFYCSFYFVPEIPDPGYFFDLLQSISGHEFLHILTPLNVHSKEIDDFDFRNPKMSQHLWMYEGVTEYFAHLVRLKAGLTDQETFRLEMEDKIKRAEQYGNVSFTEMSRNILTDQYKESYSNVYQKGALIGFVLDIRLNELSAGKKDLRWLMQELAEKFGPAVPFNDDELIPFIASITFPEIDQFFQDYVIGAKPLPIEEYFQKIGWEYSPEKEVSKWTMGVVSFFSRKESGEVYAFNMKPESNQMKMTHKDILLSVDGKNVSHDDMSMATYLESEVENREHTVKYRRGLEDLEIVCKPYLVTNRVKHWTGVHPEASPSQIELREFVLGKD